MKGSGNCRIFGFQLNSNPEMLDLETTHINTAHVSNSHSHPASIPQGSGLEIDQHTNHCKGNNSTDSDLSRKEQLQRLQSSTPTSKDASKPCNGSARSCTKVHKQGIALGRSVDLTKFNDYDELIDELDLMFDFKGELKSPNKNWLIVYTDNEDDMMLVGDDPWQEFCCIVRKIFIYTSEEVQRMNPGTLNTRIEDGEANVSVEQNNATNGTEEVSPPMADG